MLLIVYIISDKFEDSEGGAKFVVEILIVGSLVHVNYITNSGHRPPTKTREGKACVNIPRRKLHISKAATKIWILI